MSNAHRPTWNPAQGREIKGGSRQFSNKDLAAHTKLKFRQPGQTSSSDLARVDLRTQLLVAERAALDKKRKAQGLPALPPLVLPGEEVRAIEGGEDDDEESRKRRKVLEEAVALDRDDDDDDDDDGDEVGEPKKDKGKGKAVDNGSDGANSLSEGSDNDGGDDDSDSSSDDDDEDDTAELLRELEKIKRERAEEKARLEASASAVEGASREQEIAMGNPLLNLAAALGQQQGSGASDAGTSTTGGFSVKRRWDDDLIFKNQAVGSEDKGRKKEFVNDLLRTDFHRKFMGKFIK